MVMIREEQLKQMARGRVIRKLDVAFRRDIPEFRTLSDSDRPVFISEAMTIADAMGFKSEQGVTSYAMAMWWLGVDFESKSNKLQKLLECSYPEVRRAHAMNEWVINAIRVAGEVLTKTQEDFFASKGLSLLANDSVGVKRDVTPSHKEDHFTELQKNGKVDDGRGKEAN